MNALFDDAENLEPADPVARVQRGDSTPETRERYSFLRTKRLGATWEEDGKIFRMGPCGVTIFTLDHVIRSTPDQRNPEAARMASTLLDQIRLRNHPGTDITIENNYGSW